MGGRRRWIGRRASDSWLRHDRSVSSCGCRVLNLELETRDSKLFFEWKEKNCATEKRLFRGLRFDRVLAKVRGVAARSLCDGDSRRAQSDRIKKERHPWIVDYDSSQS